METGQLSKAHQVDENGVVHKGEFNTRVFDEYITFCASSGLSMDEDGNVQQMSVKEFAQEIGISRSVLYYWKANVPNFWVLVDERARQIFNQSTKYAIMKGLKLKAMTGESKAAEMVLSHYSDYVPPTQKHEVKLNGWGDVVRETRKARIKADKPIEGELAGGPLVKRPEPTIAPQSPQTPVTDGAITSEPNPSHTGQPAAYSIPIPVVIPGPPDAPGN